MLLDSDTYEEIKGEIANCIKQSGLKYPFTAIELAQSMNIALIPYSQSRKELQIIIVNASKDAVLVEFGTNVWICFNDNMMAERRDMSIFHEIGHYVLEHPHDKNKTDAVKESEASFFARYIMAPVPLIHLLPEVSIFNIRMIFGISQEAAGNALNHYNSWVRKFHKYTDYDNILLNLGFEGITRLVGKKMKEAV